MKKGKPPQWSVPSGPRKANTPIAREREALGLAFEELVQHPGLARVGDGRTFEVRLVDRFDDPGAERVVHGIVVGEEDEGGLVSLLVAAGPRSYAQLQLWCFASPESEVVCELPGHRVWTIGAAPRTGLTPAQRQQCLRDIVVHGEPRSAIVYGLLPWQRERGLDAGELALLADVARALLRALADPEFEVHPHTPGDVLTALEADGSASLTTCWDLSPAEFAEVQDLDEEFDEELEGDSDDEDDDEDDEDDEDWREVCRWDNLDPERRAALVRRCRALPVSPARVCVLAVVSRVMPVASSTAAMSATLVDELVLCDGESLAEVARMALDPPRPGESRRDVSVAVLESFVRMIENLVGALPGRLVVERSELLLLVEGLLLHGRGPVPEGRAIRLVDGSVSAPVTDLLYTRTSLARSLSDRDRREELCGAAAAWLHGIGQYHEGVGFELLTQLVDDEHAVDALQTDPEREEERAAVLDGLALFTAHVGTGGQEPWLPRHRAHIPADLAEAVGAFGALTPDLLVQEADTSFRSLLHGPVAYEDHDPEQEALLGSARLVLRVPFQGGWPRQPVTLLPRPLAEELAAALGGDLAPAKLRAAFVPWLRAALLARG